MSLSSDFGKSLASDQPQVSTAPLCGGPKNAGRACVSPVAARSASHLDHSIVASFRPVSSETDLRRVVEAARSDDHLVVCPTHLAEKDGEVVGYASIGSVPVICCWVHSKRARARESFALLRRVEEEAQRVAPAGIICTPCMFSSPFFKFMPKLGYRHVGDGGFFLKDLRNVFHS